tara:strand:- start:50 stop:475 length:426 start_codon:yes stop_codon:yes gene_type:complete
MLRLLRIVISLFFIFYLSGCNKKPNAVNIYESEEYKSLTKKEIIVGESIWATSCFRCHRYGTNGAVVAENKKYWDKAAEKGIDKLFNSVWEGYKGEHGAMPAKGFCNLCDEEEIRKSVFYMFHLAKKAQKAQAKRDSLKKI